MSVRTVTFLGADSKLGDAILAALLRHNFAITILKRSSSKSSDDYPASVAVTRITDDFIEDDLVTALKGQDAVVVSVNGSLVDLQKRIANAALKAGVKRFIPADFGSCDSASPVTQELVPLYKRKTEVREHLQSLAQQSNDSFSWTALVPGHFFDWQLEFLHIFLKEKRADILDDGETKFSVSTLERIGEATAQILARADDDGTRNQTLYVQSFCVSQQQIIAAYEKATDAKWNVQRYEADKWRDEYKKKADAGETSAVEECVWYLGTVDANWEGRQTFAMDLLGLKNEDLEEVVRKVVQRSS